MSLSNLCAQVFETSIDPYDPDYHWGGASIYPEGPVPTQVEYPGLPAGMTLPPGVPIHLDLFVTPAPPHLAHIPLECPGAPRPDRKPVKPRAVDCTIGRLYFPAIQPLEVHLRPKRHNGLYGPDRRFPSSRPAFIYAYPCADDERWAHLPEHLRPIECKLRVQSQSLELPVEESYEREPEVVELRVSHREVSSSSDPVPNEQRADASRHVNTALRRFRMQVGKESSC
ncbi:unnamed protein product [Rhizoctonia solani]|uniref:Uncharacterized protein n=1 Tax=Rhizoctonia solani TaxID=456999 RepID=A0A8H3BNP5_9AGAM|nr:unnamed protein product [Rhizoctonia solani]